MNVDCSKNRVKKWCSTRRIIADEKCKSSCVCVCVCTAWALSYESVPKFILQLTIDILLGLFQSDVHVTVKTCQNSSVINSAVELDNDRSGVNLLNKRRQGFLSAHIDLSWGYFKSLQQSYRIRDNRRGQPDLSAMEGPHPGETALLITVIPTPGKYGFVAFDWGTYCVTTTWHSLPLEGHDIYWRLATLNSVS
jgi:hypothetical protein